MRSPGINGEGELRGQPATAVSPGKIAVKMESEIITTEEANSAMYMPEVKHYCRRLYLIISSPK